MASNRKGTHAMKNRKEKEPFSFSNLSKKAKITWIAVAAVVVCLIVALVVVTKLDLLHGVTGRLRYYNGKVYDVAENDVVAKVGRSDPKYYKIAKFEIPEKYTLDEEYTVQTDKNVNEWSYRPEENGISFVYVSSVGESYEDALNSLVEANGAYNEQQGITSTEEQDYESVEGVTVNGLEFKGMFVKQSYDEETKLYHKYMNAYVDCGDKGCVMVMVYSKERKEENIASVETFRTYLEEAANCITLIEK